MNLHKLVYVMGEKIRNPLIRSMFKELKKTDFASLDELESLQNRRLVLLLKHAHQYSPFYREYLTIIDLDTFGLNDLSKIPILTKQQLRDNMDQIQNNPNKEKRSESETSGSTGDALIFEKNREWDASARAAQLRGYSWFGVNPWDKNIYFWGFNPNWKQLIKIRFLDFLMNRYRVFSFTDDELERTAKKLKGCTYVEGYSSAVYTLSNYLDKNNYQFNNVKMVKGTSEKIYDYYNTPSENVFGHKIISEYGAAETGLIAFECPEGNMHIAMENVIVEEINNKIFVTNLFSHSLPIIRYELGDYIVLDMDTRCPCGREHYIIKEVTGRIGKKIVGYEFDYPTLTLYYIFKNIALDHDIKLAYFGKQEKKGELVLEILRPKEEQKMVGKYIKEECNKYFKTDMSVEVKMIDDIERFNKKVKDFESTINE